MNTPVTFELAKLLKEKGFDKPTYSFYVIDESEYGEMSEFITNPNDNYPALDDNSLFDTLASAPTIAEVVMWLYEKHGIWISVDCDCYGILWYANLSVASEKNWDNIDLRHEIISASKKFPNEHNSPTEAYEAAIEYTLNNLI
jgi:hypothetical protein